MMISSMLIKGAMPMISFFAASWVYCYDKTNSVLILFIILYFMVRLLTRKRRFFSSKTRKIFLLSQNLVCVSYYGLITQNTYFFSLKISYVCRTMDLLHRTHISSLSKSCMCVVLRTYYTEHEQCDVRLRLIPTCSPSHKWTDENAAKFTVRSQPEHSLTYPLQLKEKTKTHRQSNENGTERI